MLKWLTGETKSLYIARPEKAANALIYQHPDRSIPRGAKVTVRADECALFFSEGQFVGSLEAGTHLLDTLNVPWLGHFLVDKFTDANHFISEIYFISLNETQIRFHSTPLGQCTDLNSRNVVVIQGELIYSIAVLDPIQMLSHVAGQSSSSEDAILSVAGGRISTVLRSIVGMRAARQPILDLVSNADGEAIGWELMAALGAEFEAIGLQLRRIMDLRLSLDAASFQLLQIYGKQEAQLALQLKGATLAMQPGFAEYNLVQGQRAALEGLGKGLGEGKPGFAMGTGFSADLTRARAPVLNPGFSRSAPRSVLTGPPLFFVLAANGEQGPFKVRQVVNFALLNRKPLADVEIRREDDPPGMYVRANNEPEIVSEYNRRSPA